MCNPVALGFKGIERGSSSVVKNGENIANGRQSFWRCGLGGLTGLTRCTLVSLN